jgi:hypothetical protein
LRRSARMPVRASSSRKWLENVLPHCTQWTWQTASNDVM